MRKSLTGVGAHDAQAPHFEIRATVEQVAIAASLFWTVAANRPFFAAVLQRKIRVETEG